MIAGDYVVLDREPAIGDTVIVSDMEGNWGKRGIVIEVSDLAIRVETPDGWCLRFRHAMTVIRAIHNVTVPQLTEQLNTLSDL